MIRTLRLEFCSSFWNNSKKIWHEWSEEIFASLRAFFPSLEKLTLDLRSFELEERTNLLVGPLLKNFGGKRKGSTN